jgi:plastocyanin
VTPLAAPLRLLLDLAAALVVAAGCEAERRGPSTEQGSQPKSGAAAKADVTVDMRNVQFLPQRARIKAGDTGLWKNSDTMAHTVTEQGGPGSEFDSGTIAPGGTFTTRSSSPAR